MSRFVGNPEDRFCRDEVHVMSLHTIWLISFKVWVIHK